MEVLTYVSCMGTAYVRENPPQNSLIRFSIPPFLVPETFGDFIFVAQVLLLLAVIFF